MPPAGRTATSARLLLHARVGALPRPPSPALARARLERAAPRLAPARARLPAPCGSHRARRPAPASPCASGHSENVFRTLSPPATPRPCASLLARSRPADHSTACATERDRLEGRGRRRGRPTRGLDDALAVRLGRVALASPEGNALNHGEACSVDQSGTGAGTRARRGSRGTEEEAARFCGRGEAQGDGEGVGEGRGRAKVSCVCLASTSRAVRTWRVNCEGGPEEASSRALLVVSLDEALPLSLASSRSGRSITCYAHTALI